AAAHRAGEAIGIAVVIGNELVVEPVRGLVLLLVVVIGEGGDVAADHLRIAAAVIDRGPATELRVAGRDVAARRQVEVDQAAAAHDRAQIERHTAARPRDGTDVVVAGGDVYAVEGLCVVLAGAAGGDERSAGQDQRRLIGEDVARGCRGR